MILVDDTSPPNRMASYYEIEELAARHGWKIDLVYDYPSRHGNTNALAYLLFRPTQWKA